MIVIVSSASRILSILKRNTFRVYGDLQELYLTQAQTIKWQWYHDLTQRHSFANMYSLGGDILNLYFNLMLAK